MKKVIVLGCSGSIGKSTISILKEFSDRFQVVGLQANTDEDFLINAAKDFNCKRNCLTGKNLSECKNPETVNYVNFYGKESLKEFIQYSGADIVVNGIAGSSGLMSSVYTLEKGINLALANKETMVMAGKIVRKIAKEHDAKILPVDSEHSAIFSLLEKCRVCDTDVDSAENLIITASGGPFRNYSKEELENVTLEKALSHPTWNMGPKITIDSSTLANKGLEVIEAYMLFDFDVDHIKVTVHPQSLVHSMVQTKDGQIYAQISKPDMRHPILMALTHPECLSNSLEKVDLTKLIEMQFMPPRLDVFPMLQLAYDSLRNGGSSTIVFNAANEVAVELFRQQKIKYTHISKIVEETLAFDWSKECTTIDEVLEIDADSRKKAYKIAEKYEKIFGENNQ
ncbi:MAG: 1-deoxy-D-xylulose-5-phosphate reductoisomerase [Treponemataceae bacterium]|nr:1-deoxy-D-xylulose-5-phosphate reductoisomerase [Treponemataceae bacterium]